MRIGSPQLLQALTGSFDSWWECDVLYDDDLVKSGLPVTGVTTTEDATAQVQYAASLTIVYQDDFGQSIVPTAIQSPLSPFGTQLVLYLNVAAGPLVERVRFGTFFISSVPSAQTFWGFFQGQGYSKGDRIQVSLSDLFWRTQKNQFDSPSAPTSLASGWAEIQRLTGLPVDQSVVADAAIPSSTTYQTNRLDAVYQIGTVLGGVPYITPTGAVGMRPTVWPAPVDTINGGEGGTLITAVAQLDPSLVYNVFVMRDQSGNPLASASITDGPLRAANTNGTVSPYGRVPYYYSSPFVTTAAQGNAYARAHLSDVSTLRAQLVTLTETLNPLRDLGDVVTVNRIVSGQIVQTFQGRVQQIQRSGKTQTTVLAVGQ